MMGHSIVCWHMERARHRPIAPKPGACPAVKCGVAGFSAATVFAPAKSEECTLFLEPDAVPNSCVNLLLKTYSEFLLRIQVDVNTVFLSTFEIMWLIRKGSLACRSDVSVGVSAARADRNSLARLMATTH